MTSPEENNSKKLDLTINASPTKEFFISILVRDIKLVDAIADLVDNCVDGARRLRPEIEEFQLVASNSTQQNISSNKKYSGLKIEIKFSRDSFSILDNCGGISLDIAQNYAFRFGRPEGMPPTKGSVGQFGVGMKRSLFKIGNKFEIKSTVHDADFELDIDVKNWKTSLTEDGKEKWEFDFKTLNKNVNHDLDKCGTEIKIIDLYPVIAEEFSNKIFENRLFDTIQSAHEQSIKEGLEIEINGYQIQHHLSTLLVSNEIKPIKIIKEYVVSDTISNSNVKVIAKIYAGISEQKLDEAGWYVICNGRQILRADKTKITGWDDVVNEEKLPKAHYQFARFRGYIFFESDNASALPWNTMKNTVDSESSAYQAAKLEMGIAMRQIINFLNKVDSENDSTDTTLQVAISQARPSPLTSVSNATTFLYPQVTTTNFIAGPVKINFTRTYEEVEFAKNFFDVVSAKAVGNSVFEYFYEREKE